MDIWKLIVNIQAWTDRTKSSLGEVAAQERRNTPNLDGNAMQ
jgi:hypothetical protein